MYALLFFLNKIYSNKNDFYYIWEAKTSSSIKEKEICSVKALNRNISLNRNVYKLVLSAHNSDCEMIIRARLFDSIVADRVPLMR